MATPDEATAREVASDVLDQIVSSVTADTIVGLLIGEDYELDEATAGPIAHRAVELIAGATYTLPTT